MWLAQQDVERMWTWVALRGNYVNMPINQGMGLGTKYFFSSRPSGGCEQPEPGSITPYYI